MLQFSSFAIMKRKATFCCDASRGMYEDYYTGQSGRGMPVFVGARYQRGHGLGSILSGLIRRIILPFFRAHGKTIARKAIKTGVQVADDVAQGKRLKASLKRRIPTGIKEAVEKIDSQTGSGTSKSKRRRLLAVHRRRRAPSRRKTGVRRRRYNDIFAR